MKLSFEPVRRELGWQIKHRWRASPQQRAHHHFRRALDWMRQGDIAIDCGCNQGWITSALAATGATIYSFDPEPSVAAAMDVICRERANVVFQPKAVGTQAGQIRMYRHESFSEDPLHYSLSSSIFGDKRHASAENTFDVEVISLPSFIRELEKPVAVLKLDIEGAEVAILHALIDEGLLDRVGAVFAEMHEDRIVSLQSESLRLRQRIAGSKLARKIHLDWQ